MCHSHVSATGLLSPGRRSLCSAMVRSDRTRRKLGKNSPQQLQWKPTPKSSQRSWKKSLLLSKSDNEPCPCQKIHLASESIPQRRDNPLAGRGTATRSRNNNLCFPRAEVFSGWKIARQDQCLERHEAPDDCGAYLLEQDHGSDGSGGFGAFASTINSSLFSVPNE